VKPDAAHDVDRYRKDAESDGGVSAEMRAAAAKVDAIIGSADLTKFARLVEDSPADAMMLTMMVMVANAQRARDTDRGDAACLAIKATETSLLARYDAKPKVER
jgi:hypothetical protein